jgi:signal transduction histidine kinase
VDLVDLRGIGLFAATDDDQLLALRSAGSEVAFECGDVLFEENHPAESWWVLLEGSIDLVRHVGHEETRLGAMTVPGQWAGGFRAWDEHGAYLATGRATTAGRMLSVPAAALRSSWTARFPLGLHLIEGVSRSARNYEAMARQREALAALGTLAAGLAHELNNPAAAAARAVDALAEACEEMLSSLRRLAAAPISADQFAGLDALRRELELRPAGAMMDVADREDAVTDWLSGHDVTRDWMLAPALAAAGADVEWCERVAGALGGPPLEPGLEWVAATVSVAGLVEEAKGDITVVRDFGPDVPRIQALAAELNQVWTNLIDNALHAMAGAGTLRISTRLDRDAVVVEIADTGSGMSPETQKHAFDPFYTTKGVGEGTGLGLDISRRIVDRHRGDIGIDVRPGETVLRVRLPVTGVRAAPGAPAHVRG